MQRPTTWPAPACRSCNLYPALPLHAGPATTPNPEPLPAGPAITRGGGGKERVEPTSQHFSGLVFKLQANMDPRHRDKVAFVRVVSGEGLGGVR